VRLQEGYWSKVIHWILYFARKYGSEPVNLALNELSFTRLMDTR
jgi:hypothetical protein